MSFLGLGAEEVDDSDHSLIHQDSDDEEDPIHDDDVDIGFRRHQYETFEDDDGNQRRLRKSRQRNRDEATYGVFLEDDEDERRRKRSRTVGSGGGTAPLFVSAKKEVPATALPTFQKATGPSEKSDSATNNDKELPQNQQEGDKESPEEMEIRAKQQAADDHFNSLLKQAQGRKRRLPQHQEVDSTSKPSTTQNAMPATTDHSANHLQFFTQPQEKNVRKDPSVAKWEKHTKGFGSKLLAKMGWKGTGGLGSNRRKVKSDTNAEGTTTATTPADSAVPNSESAASETAKARKGISRPVEVVVRPANLGLGFGNFKEMSQLKSNRQIEAEVRGIEIPKKNKGRSTSPDDEPSSWGDGVGTVSSSMPTMKDLMQQKSWKKLRTNKPKPKVIPYEELLAQHEKKSNGNAVIIDMRGPSAEQASTTTDTDGKVPLGEELLYNVTFLLNTYENKLLSSSHLLKSTKLQAESLESEISDLKQQQVEVQERKGKLKQVLSVVEQVETITEQEAADDNASNTQQQKVTSLVQELSNSLSAEDRQTLNFWQVLAPALLNPVIKRRLDHWDPLGSLANSKRVLEEIFHLQLNTSLTSSSSQDKDSLHILRVSIIRHQLVPRIKQVLESPQWDPSRDTDSALDLYEYLQESTTLLQGEKPTTKLEQEEHPEGQVLPNGIVEEEETSEKEVDMATFLKQELILDGIYPKLQAALSHWKPSLGAGKRFGLEDRFDLWILPWVPHMDHPAILPNLLSDCKRKLKSAISYLQRKAGREDDRDVLHACMGTLRPWQTVFDPPVLQRLVSEYVTPTLARCLSKARIRQDSSEQSWSVVRLAFEFHSRNLLSDLEFLSIMEGELFPNLAAKVHKLLSQGDKTAAVVSIYQDWKKQTLVKPVLDDEAPVSLKRSREVLQEDASICRIFYTVLRMIQLSQIPGNEEELDRLHFPPTNYRVVSGRRAKESRGKVQDDIVRMESRSTGETEARIRLRRRQVDTPTFREVLEELASERGVLFQPRMGTRALKDGKQVFLFGDIPLYIEGDVVYVDQKSAWRPVSLDRLADLATGGS